jgi:hypothetical protein
MMTRYFKVSVWAVLFGFVMFPCNVSAASITETSAEIGQGCTASGINSTAMGYYTVAIGKYSTAMGAASTASGWYSTAMGLGTTASSSYATAMGFCTTASGSYSTVIGKGYDPSNTLINDNSESFMVGFMADESDTIPELLVKDGAVGIGTTTPVDMLEVQGNLSVDGSGGLGVIRLRQNDSLMWTFMTASWLGNNDLRFKNETSGTAVMTFDNQTNYVGIGTTDPGEKLDIDKGNGRVDSGFEWLTNSDIRLKQNVSTLDKSLEKITHLRGVRFDIKNDEFSIKSKGKHIGVIAQELEKEYPELVVGDEKTGFKAVAYDKLTAVLIEAVKELKLQNEQQEAENASLRTENVSLKKDIEKIKKILGI